MDENQEVAREERGISLDGQGFCCSKIPDRAFCSEIMVLQLKLLENF